MGYFLNINIGALKTTGKYHIEPALCQELDGFADGDYDKPVYKTVPTVRITRLSDGKVMVFDQHGCHASCHCSYSGKLAAEVAEFVPKHTVTRSE